MTSAQVQVRENKKNIAWIHSLPFDLFFFAAPWWFLFVPIAFSFANNWQYLGFFLLAYQALLRTPHVLATVPVTYLIPENKTHYKKFWGRFFALPIFIVALYWFFGSNLWDGIIPKVLLTISAIWGLQHISFQNLGVYQLYKNRAGKFDPVSRRVSQILFLCVFMSLTIAQGVIKFWAPHLLSAGVKNGILYSQYFLVLLAAAYDISRSWHLGRRALPGSIFLFCALMGAIYWPFYDYVPQPGSGLLLFYLVYSGHHQLGYLGLTYYLVTNREMQSSGANPRFFTAQHFLRSFIPLFLVSVVLTYLGYRATVNDSHYTELQKLYLHSFAFLEGIFVVHFYLDSISWKARDAHARKTLFAYLEPLAK